MPKLHPTTGLAACGTGGGRVSYGDTSGVQTQLCDGGCTFWFDANHIAFIGPESGSWAGGRELPQIVNIHTGVRTNLEPVAPGTERLANFMTAGGGRWQAAIAGPVGATFGSCGEFPGGSLSRATTDSRGAASADGTIVLIDSYQGSNNGFRLARADGTITERIADGTDPYHLTAIDATRAIWPWYGAWGVYGIAPPLWMEGSYRACWCEAGGKVWLVHWLNGVGLVAREPQSTRGRILHTADNAFHYDAIAWQGGIRFAFATIDGEPPGSLVIQNWDGVSDIEDLIPAPPPVVQPSFHFAHPVMVRPFFATGSGKADVFTLGTYTESTTLPDPMPEGRLVITHDSDKDWTIPAGLRPFDLPLIEYYRTTTETLSQSADRWLRQTESLLAQWPGDVGVIPMFYCQGGAPPDELWTVQDVLDGLGYLSTLVNWSARIKVIAPFAYQRANGIVAHVELQDAFDNLCTESDRVGEPALIEPIDPPDPPDPPIDPPVPSYFGLTDHFPAR